MKINRSTAFQLRRGFRDGIPIGLGYLAVSFSLGIAARSSGLTAFQGFLASALENASAGEYAAFSLIAESGSYLAMALVTLVANARYLLMSCALSQRLPPDLPLLHRIGLGFYITDEFFGITIAQRDPIRPTYTYGAVLAAAPCWAVGTALGILLGNVLPASVTTALGVSLYGMFIAIIIPPINENKTVGLLVALGFLLSYLASRFLPAMSGGTRVIVLTVVISAAAAVLFPIKEPAGKGEGSHA